MPKLKTKSQQQRSDQSKELMRKRREDGAFTTAENQKGQFHASILMTMPDDWNR